MSLVRVLRTAQQVLTRKVYADETLTDASGTVAVEVRRLDGTLLTSGNATDAPGTGAYSFTLPGGPAAPASVTWQLDTLVVTWTGSFGGATVTLPPDYVEVVGGFIFGLAEARDEPPPLDPQKYPIELLRDKRVEVEQTCERITETAWVPRFMRVAVSGSGHSDLVTPHADLRVLRAVQVDGVPWDQSAVAAVKVSTSGVLTLWPGGVWPAGRDNVILEYEFGLNAPLEPIRTACKVLLRSRLTPTSSAVPSRALSFTAPDGGVYRLSIPSKERTGIPDVDAEFERLGLDLGGFA